MKTTNKKNLAILKSIEKGLIVSCQVYPDEPFYTKDMALQMAKAAAWGGAVAIRANSAKDVKMIKNEIDLPVIGLDKVYYPDTDVFITPTLESCVALWEAGADIIAFDCTNQINHEGKMARELLPILRKKLPDALLFADISNFEEAKWALENGADIVAPTLYGYTEATKDIMGPDFREFAKMCRELSKIGYVWMEGHIYTAEDTMKAFYLGAHSVVVGGAITRPHLTTKRFVDLISGYQDNWRKGENIKHEMEVEK